MSALHFLRMLFQRLLETICVLLMVGLAVVVVDDAVVGFSEVEAAVVVVFSVVEGAVVVEAVVLVDDEVVDDSPAVLGLSGVVTRRAPSGVSWLTTASPLTARKLSVSRLSSEVTSVVPQPNRAGCRRWPRHHCRE